MQNLGFSGDRIEVQGNHVYKTCQTNQERFLKNIFKQKTFQNPYINSVPILEQGLTIEGYNYIKMPFLQCENSLLWLSRARVEDINNLISKMSYYFKYIINHSELRRFENKVWLEKITSLQSQIKDAELCRLMTRLLDLQTDPLFYYGESHGDLTLSNIFITQENTNITIDAIDFLDSFIYSPINDLVKFRQDTCHLWTLHLLNDQENIDKNRMVIILDYIDKKIENIIQNDTSLSHYYIYFQILNLLRIVPYNSNQRTLKYLKKEIRELSQCLPH